MKRISQVLILALLFSALALVTAHVAGAPPEAVRGTVVLVAKRNPETRRYVAMGTAFHIGDGWFRTAAHVVRASLPKRYEGKGYEEWALYRADEFGNPERYLGKFETICVDRRWVHDEYGGVFPHDSALIRLSGGSPSDIMLRAGTSRPRIGDAVSVWGFPQGTILFESKAKVARVSDQWIEVQEDVGRPVIGGHSGSPVINQAQEVIGIMSAGVQGVAQRGAAVPLWDAEIGCPRP